MRLTVRRKLLGGFAVVLLLATVAGTTGLVVMERAALHLETMYERNVIGLIDLSEADLASPTWS